jgi:hypothetical protein
MGRSIAEVAHYSGNQCKSTKQGGNRFHLIIRWSRGILIARHIHQRSCEEMLSPNVARGFCEEASEEQWVSPLD